MNIVGGKGAQIMNIKNRLNIQWFSTATKNFNMLFWMSVTQRGLPNKFGGDMGNKMVMAK